MRNKLFGVIFFSIVTLGLLSCSYGDGPAPVQSDVSKYLQTISCNIHAGRAQGSGVITAVGDTSYVWTAGHVVANLKRISLGYDEAGRAKKTTSFDDAEIVQEFVEDGRTVGEVMYAAEIVRYSNSDTGEDLALLRVRKKKVTTEKVKFYLEDKVPVIGADLYHVGSLLGQGGYNSMTSGLLSQIGRVYMGHVYDQTSCTAFPGSSGGGVFFRSGDYIGMLVRGSGETFNLMVPVRRMAAYAKRTGVYFAMDGSDKAPPDVELKKLPIEEGTMSEKGDMPGAVGKFQFRLGTWDR